VASSHHLLRDRRYVRGVEKDAIVDDREIATDAERVVGALMGLVAGEASASDERESALAAKEAAVATNARLSSVMFRYVQKSGA
jgi:hypothetical protein